MRFWLKFVKQLENGYYKRYYCTKSVRVRFAPSPTGFLHLGGLRTALYNHLFAKSQNGVTILRIEDTDLTRKINNATENLIEDLAWCGIKYDEGPYFQSDRIDIYKKHAEQLLDQGDAYHCFCSNARLNLLKKSALVAGEIPKYDNCCRHLSEKEVKEKLESGSASCIRFKLNSTNEGFEDLIQGHFYLDIAKVEGDPVIMKSDGFPTYHFANVVDDHLMNITHVLRGAEWQVSTPKHILIYKAMKWKPPLFGHLPLLLNPDGSKFSKRQSDARIEELRQRGYFPNSVINFLIRFGSGFDIDYEQKNVKIFTFDELVEKFNISRIKSSSSKVSLSLLDDCNQLELHRLFKTEEGINELIKKTKEVVRKHFENRNDVNELLLDDQQIKLILEKFQCRIKNLKELVEDDYIFLWTWKNTWNGEDKHISQAVEKLLSEIAQMQWNREHLKTFLSKFSETVNVKYSQLMKALRLILSNKKDGPSVVDIMELLGKDRTIYRLSRALNH